MVLAPDSELHAPEQEAQLVFRLREVNGDLFSADDQRPALTRILAQETTYHLVRPAHFRLQASKVLTAFGGESA
jgi:hypothetical protein